MSAATDKALPIVERLRRKTLYRPNKWQLANPNGPEAADTIEALVEVLVDARLAIEVLRTMLDRLDLRGGVRTADIQLRNIDAALAKAGAAS